MRTQLTSRPATAFGDPEGPLPPKLMLLASDVMLLLKAPAEQKERVA
jgi:hypothetical protein